MARRAFFSAFVVMALWARQSSAAVIDATYAFESNNNWNDPDVWDILVVPNNNATNQYNVRIDNHTSNVTVSLNISPTINNLTIDAGDVLAINNNTSLTIAGGSITNNGTLNLQAAGSLTDLRISGSTLLSGGGIVTLTNSVNNRIYGVNAAHVLTVAAGRSISGSGQIGVDFMGLTNQGTIDANVTSALTIDPSAAGVTNTGTLQASSGGTLVLTGGTFTNAGGLIRALDGSQVQLTNMSLAGGTLSRTGSGRIVVPNNTTLTLTGPITLNAPLEVNAAGNFTDLLINGNFTLEGSEGIVLSNSVNNRIYGVNAAHVLTVAAGRSISGSGQIGVDFMGLTNQGTIDANVTSALTIDPSAAGVTNTGTLQASSGGTLVLTGGTFTNAGGLIRALDGSQVQLTNMSLAGGTLSRTGSGRIVVPNNTTLTLTGPITLNAPLEVNAAGNFTDLLINGNFTLEGSEGIVLSNSVNNRIYGVNAAHVLTVAAGRSISGSGQIGVDFMGLTNQGTIDANVTSALTIDPSAAGVTNTGTLQASSGGTLVLTGGTFTNAGGLIRALDGSQVQLTNMSLAGGTLSRTGSGRIVVPNNTTLTLTGPITLNAPLEVNAAGNFTDLLINGNFTLEGSEGIVLSNSVNNRIYGVNAAHVLTVAAGRSISGSGQIGVDFMGLTNQGTIDANVTSALTIDPSAAGVTNTGTLQASSGGTLVLTGGTFTNAGGLIRALDGSQVQLTNMSLAGGTLARTGSGRIVVPNNTTLTLTGPITLNAPLEVNAAGNFTDLLINGNFTLEGSEGIVLSNSVNNRIYGVNAAHVLTVAAGRSISGSGQIGVDFMGLTNQGTIDANVTSALTIDPSAAGVTNTGTLQASSGGTLVLTGGTFTNAGGLIRALDGSQVQLTNMSLAGGTLSRTGSGRIVVPNNTTLTLTGPITLNAPLEVNAAGNFTDLLINGNFTLEGSEGIVLSNSVNNRIYGVNAAHVLTVAAGRSISGSGQIGVDFMGLTNQGTIDANVGSPLTIDPTNSLTVVNETTGILRGSGMGGLQLTGGTFDNQGTVEALNGSNVTYSTSAVAANNAAGVLTGGKWRAISTGNAATITLRGTNITQIAANTEVDLSGAMSVLRVATTPLETTLTSNAGTLRISDARIFTMTNALHNAGSIRLSNATLSSNVGVTNAAAGSINGTGTLRGNLTSAGAVRPGNSPGILTIQGDYVQQATGVLDIEVGGLTPGTQHDRLDVIADPNVPLSGKATLAGRLDVRLINNFTPAVDNEIEILTAASGVIGQFHAVFVPNSPSLPLELTYNQNNVLLRFVAAVESNQVPNLTGEHEWSTIWTTLPETNSVANLTNASVADLTANVANADAFVHQLTVSGGQSTTTVAIQDGRFLSSTAGVEIQNAGVVELVGGTLSTNQVAVKSGGLIKGDGALLGDLVNVVPANAEPSVVDVGVAIGHLDVGGNFIQAGAGTLAIEVAGGGVSDTVTVGGAADLGGVLNILIPNDGSVEPGDRFEILTAGSLAEGVRFDEVHSFGNPNLVARPVYLPGEVDPAAAAASAPAVTARRGFDSEITEVGDMNWDFVVNAGDVSAFALALRDPRSYEDTYFITGGEIGNMDHNNRGLDFDDIDEFAARLAMSVPQLLAAMQVPEPSAWVLGAVGCVMVVIRRRKREVGCPARPAHF